MATTLRHRLPPTNLKITDSLAGKIQKFLDFAHANVDRQLLFTGHTVADSDTIGTSVALSSIFRNGVVTFQDQPRSSTRFLLELLHIEPVFVSSFGEGVGIVLGDVSSKFRTRFVNGREVVAVVDHHKLSAESHRPEIYVVDTMFSTASLLAYEILQRGGYSIDDRTALALAVGIVGDLGENAIINPLYPVSIMQFLSRAIGISEEDIIKIAFPPLTGTQTNTIALALQDAYLFEVDSLLPNVGKIRCASTFCGDETVAPIAADRFLSNSFFSEAFNDTLDAHNQDVSVVFARSTEFDRNPRILRVSIRFSDRLALAGFCADKFGRLLGNLNGGNGGGHDQIAGAVLLGEISAANKKARIALEQYFAETVPNGSS